ncbi:MAG TPA: phosphatidylserine/phosphatidylglycerophosphate/cardiolipin synthase family protein [Gaiellaceae bacterium]|nr:phosphatidylserine/phosphatidylglycerophosphate/cardiolipin synthase family protein [Gaiellaceae bacterium]
MPPAIDLRTLRDGGQSASDVAGWIADFLEPARSTLDFAHYDFHLQPGTASIVGGAIRAAAARDVAVRFVYNVDHRNPIPVPPPPEPDVKLIASLGIPAHAIAGDPDLMHHKYVVRDRETVWTGSMNWTDDSFAIQENVLVTVTYPDLAARYTTDFEQLWTTGEVQRSGFVDPVPLTVAGTGVRAWFTPGHGEELSVRIAKHLAKARRRVRICSPVLTAAPVLATLAQLAAEGELDIAGCVDEPQVRGVIYQWNQTGNVRWKLPLLEQALKAPFSAKPSTPWEPEGTPHDFMHAKVTVADDVVFLGSFNLSRSGERNAEDMLEIHDAELADRLAAFVDEVRALYPRFMP